MAESSQRFLVIRLSSIGDIIHALPAVAALGETFPAAEVHWAVERRHAALVEGNPSVHRALKVDTLGWRKKVPSPEAIQEVVQGILALRESTYQAAIDFQGLFKSGLLARLSRSERRLGFAENWLREPVAGIFYTDRVAPRGRKHVIEMNLALVERLGARIDGWQFPLPRSISDGCYVARQLASLSAQDFIVISPGGGWKGKCWAPENYAGLIRRLASELAWKVFLTGSPAEEDLIRGILQRAASSQAAYFPATILQFIALVSRARLFIGGDSGPLHIAAAVRTPIVAIYGSEDRLNTLERNGPFSTDDITVVDRSRVASTRWTEDSGYLTGVSVESVLSAVRQRLAKAYG